MCRQVVFYYACCCTSIKTTECGGFPVTGGRVDRLGIDTEILRPRYCLQDRLYEKSTNVHALEEQKCSNIELRKIGPKALVCFKCFHQRKYQERPIGHHEASQPDIPAGANLEKVEFKREGYFRTFNDKIDWCHVNIVQAVEKSSLRFLTQRMPNMHEHTERDAVPGPANPGPAAAGPSRPKKKWTEEQKEQRMNRARDLIANPHQWRERQKARRLALKAEKADDQRRIDSGAVLEPWTPQNPTDPNSTTPEPAATSREMFEGSEPSWEDPSPAAILPYNAATARSSQETFMTEPTATLPQRQPTRNGRPRPQYQSINYRQRPHLSVNNLAQQHSGYPSVNTTRPVVGGSMRAEAAPFYPIERNYSADMPQAQTFAGRSGLWPEAGPSMTREQFTEQVEIARHLYHTVNSSPLFDFLRRSMQVGQPRPKRTRVRHRNRGKQHATWYGQPGVW